LLDDNVFSWCRAFSFLRTNMILKSLKVDADCDSSTEPCVLAFCKHIVAALQENASLEILSILCHERVKIKAEDYFVLVTALQHNTTLRSLTKTSRWPSIRCLSGGADEV
jgi:hypothetical protein